MRAVSLSLCRHVGARGCGAGNSMAEDEHDELGISSKASQRQNIDSD